MGKRLTPPPGILTLHTNHDTGCDANDGLTAPKKTVQNALETILDGYDVRTIDQSSPIVIRMADNVTDTTGVHFAPHAAGLLHGTAGIAIQGGINSAFCVNGRGAIELFYGAVVRIKDVKVSSTGAGVLISRGAQAFLSGVEFGPNTIHIQINTHGHCELEGPVSISGNASYTQIVSLLGSFLSNGYPVDILTDMNVLDFVNVADGSQSRWSSSTINLNGHVVRGRRYFAGLNGVVVSGNGSPNFFPGDQPGQLYMGGQCG